MREMLSPAVCDGETDGDADADDDAVTVTDGHVVGEVWMRRMALLPTSATYSVPLAPMAMLIEELNCAPVPAPFAKPDDPPATSLISTPAHPRPNIMYNEGGQLQTDAPPGE